MSRELIGSNGEIVGSTRYFERLNGENFLGKQMRWGQSTDYYECIQEIVSRTQGAIQEIYEDLRSNIGIIRYIPQDNRENLIKVLLGLCDMCGIISANSGRSSDCISILSLSDSGTRPQSNASDHEIEEAAKAVEDSDILTRSDRMDIIRKAMDWGESAVNGNLEEKIFLRAASQARGREFLGDIWLKLLYSNNPGQFTGHCGRVLCTQEYIDHIEKHIFQMDIPNYYERQNGDRAYGQLLFSSLEGIEKAIARDLERGIRENDYIQDENAEKLKKALNSLERCGVRCYTLVEKVSQLSWFVGGDPAKIRKLQASLNEMHIGQHLTEDGVYGAKTLQAWENFLNCLEHGTFPSLVWIDLLQNKKTGITIGHTKNGGLEGLNNALMRGGRPYIRFDPIPNGTETAWVRGKKTPIDYPHVNFDPMADSNALYDFIQKQYNHYPLTDDTYNALKDLKDVGKKVKIAGKVLLVAGAALDALELGMAIDADLKDADKKLGKTTASTVGSIGGRWIGAAAGAKAGAALGAMTGPAAPIAIPILSIMGGIGGSFAGDYLAKWVVDITYVED